MEKLEKNKKIESWTKKDVILNVLVCLINAGVFFGLAFFMLYKNLATENATTTYETYFNNSANVFGIVSFIVLSVFLTDIFFIFYDRNYIKKAGNLEMVFLIMQVSIFVCYVIGKYLNVNLRPIALVGVISMFLMEKLKAMFLQIQFCLIGYLLDKFTVVGAFFVPEGYYVLLLAMATGLISFIAIGNSYTRFSVLLKSLIISVPSLAFIGMPLGGAGTTSILKASLLCLASGPITVAIALIVLPFFEVVFSKITCFKLSELADHRSKILSMLNSQAPGTFNHSVMVANLAEACAKAIGEDALLARVCGYYHDVGKLSRPNYFTENQGEVNPHDNFTPELSVNIIKRHTVDGFELLKQASFPKEIADVCVEHHGTMPILYFYDKAKKLTDGDLDIKEYCYVGPRPKSKISAIIMICDTLEAIGRTLTDRSKENVTKIVNGVVKERLDFGQFDECDITIRELDIIKQTLINNFSGIYHERIEYPDPEILEQELNGEEKNA